MLGQTVEMAGGLVRRADLRAHWVPPTHLPRFDSMGMWVGNPERTVGNNPWYYYNVKSAWMHGLVLSLAEFPCLSPGIVLHSGVYHYVV